MSTGQIVLAIALFYLGSAVLFLAALLCATDHDDPDDAGFELWADRAIAVLDDDDLTPRRRRR